MEEHKLWEREKLDDGKRYPMTVKKEEKKSFLQKDQFSQKQKRQLIEIVHAYMQTVHEMRCKWQNRRELIKYLSLLSKKLQYTMQEREGGQGEEETEKKRKHNR